MDVSVLPVCWLEMQQRTDVRARRVKRVNTDDTILSELKLIYLPIRSCINPCTLAFEWPSWRFPACSSALECLIVGRTGNHGNIRCKLLHPYSVALLQSQKPCGIATDSDIIITALVLLRSLLATQVHHTRITQH